MLRILADYAILPPNPQSPIPNPQSPIPNPQSRIPNPQSRIPNPGAQRLYGSAGCSPTPSRFQALITATAMVSALIPAGSNCAFSAS